LGWSDIEPILRLIFSSPFSLVEVLFSFILGYLFSYIIRTFIRKKKKNKKSKLLDTIIGRMVLGLFIQAPVLIIVSLIRNIKPFFSWDSICQAIPPTIVFTCAILVILYIVLTICKDEE